MPPAPTPPVSLRHLFMYIYIYFEAHAYSLSSLPGTTLYQVLHTPVTKQNSLQRSFTTEILNLIAGALVLVISYIYIYIYLYTWYARVKISRNRQRHFYQLYLQSQGSVGHLAGARAEHGHGQVCEHAGHGLAVRVLEVLSVGPHLFPRQRVYRAAVNLAPLDDERPTRGLGKSEGKERRREGGLMSCMSVVVVWPWTLASPFETEHRAHYGWKVSGRGEGRK